MRCSRCCDRRAGPPRPTRSSRRLCGTDAVGTAGIGRRNRRTPRAQRGTRRNSSRSTIREYCTTSTRPRIADDQPDAAMVEAGAQRQRDRAFCAAGRAGTHRTSDDGARARQRTKSARSGAHGVGEMGCRARRPDGHVAGRLADAAADAQRLLGAGAGRALSARCGQAHRTAQRASLACDGQPVARTGPTPRAFQRTAAAHQARLRPRVPASHVTARSGPPGHADRRARAGLVRGRPGGAMRPLPAAAPSPAAGRCSRRRTAIVACG